MIPRTYNTNCYQPHSTLYVLYRSYNFSHACMNTTTYATPAGITAYRIIYQISFSSILLQKSR